MNATAGSDAIVYEQAGYVHLFDVKTGQSKRLSIDVVGDFPWARAQIRRVSTMIRDASLSPTGVRAAFEARGEIFTVPADKGDSRNLSQTPGAHDRLPVWSPDGAQLAWLSDASGEYQLMLGDQSDSLAAPSRCRRPLTTRTCRGRPAARRCSRGQPSESLYDRRRDRSRGEDRDRRVQHPWPRSRCGVVARLQVDCVLEGARQPFARDLPVLAGRRQAGAGHRRSRRRDLARIRCRRQVSLFPRQHRLRPAHRLGRDERRGSAGEASGYLAALDRSFLPAPRRARARATGQGAEGIRVDVRVSRCGGVPRSVAAA